VNDGGPFFYREEDGTGSRGAGVRDGMKTEARGAAVSQGTGRQRRNTAGASGPAVGPRLNELDEK
jgi:hypothetical protein